jgi:cytoskeletal protein CcmA (bactofilin family)
MPAAESSTVFARGSLPNDPRNEFEDFRSDTNASFDAWLDSLRPKPIESSAPASPFTFEGTLRIDCHVKASLVNSQTGTLIVGAAGEVQANILVATAIVDGLVRGDIRASERVELGATARVFGNIEAPALAIQPGAVFEGQCHFLPPLRKTDDEIPARSSVDDSLVTEGSLRRTRSRPDQQERAEAMAIAAGR